MATIRDVAKQSGVSIASVSRIMNNDPSYKVSDETRKKVLDTIRELNYRPSEAYTRKKTVSHKIGIINKLTIEKTKDSYFSEILNGITEYLKEQGQILDFTQAQYESLSVESIENMFVIPPKGLIVMDMLPEEALVLLKAKIKHIVGIDTNIDTIDNVRYNRFQAGYQAMEHLVSNGHKKIAYIGSHIIKDNITNIGRFEAYTRMMNLYNYEIDPDWIIDCEWHRQICFDKTIKLLNCENRPTAIFVASDHMAIAAISAIHHENLVVPEDISVVSISNIEASKYLNPPLTTVNIPQREIGIIAANTLLQRINGDTTGPKQIYVPTKLVVRNSVKPI
jgi:LacI family transcriptional regulator